MVDEIKSVPKLPIFGNKDGDQIADRYGNRYEFNAERDEWIYLGQISSPNTVTESIDGLVSPSIQRKLEHIKRLQVSGFNFNLFKLFNKLDKDPYFFLFQSSDHLITFSPEIIRKDLLLIAQDAVTGVDHDSDTTIVMVTSALTDAIVGMPVMFITGALRRETFTIISNTATSFTLSGALSVDIGDIFRIYEPETVAQKLRLEVNRDKLYRLLTGKCCVGPKGKKGPKGQAGLDGDPAADELFGSPTVIGDTVLISATVAAPIDTPISLRIFEDGVVVVEALVALDGSGADIIISGDGIEIDDTASSIVYDRSSNILQAEIKFVAGTDKINEWQFKARQRGPKGATGKDGSSFFQIIEQTISDPAIRSTNAIVSIRKSDINDSLFLTKDVMFSTICTSNLRPASTEFPISTNIDEVSLLAVEISTRDCKDIGNFLFKPIDNTPTLALPLWTPTKDCIDPRRHFQYKFDWYNELEEKYPFKIFQNPVPDESCCADPFFFCGNLGDTCGIKGQPKPPTFFAPKSVCKCISPAEFDLQGNGFLLDPINESGSTSINGVLTSRSDHYMQELIVTGTVYTLEMVNTDACSGDEFEVIDCPINVTVIITGNCTVDNPVQNVNGNMPIIIEFNITSNDIECELMVDIVANTEGADCCTGYLLTTTLTPPPGIVTGGSGGDSDFEVPPDSGFTQDDPVGTNPPGAATVKHKKYIAGIPIGRPLGTAAAPPPPTAPPPQGTAAEQIIISISSASIDSNNNVIIIGQNFTINGVSIVSSVLFSTNSQFIFTVVSSTTIQTTLPVALLAGSSIQIQLILTVPPGLSNIVLGQVPSAVIIPPTPPTPPTPPSDAQIENFDPASLASWFDVRGPFLFIAPQQIEGTGAFEVQNIVPFSTIITIGPLSGAGAPPWDFSMYSSFELYYAKEFDPLEGAPADFLQVQLVDSSFIITNIFFGIPPTHRYASPHILIPTDFKLVSLSIPTGPADLSDIIEVRISTFDFGTSIGLNAWYDDLVGIV